MSTALSIELPLAVLEILPNPVMVKDSELRYVWVNPAFEKLFGIHCYELRGKHDSDVFEHRVTAGNGGWHDIERREPDKTRETVLAPDGTFREMITQESRMTLSDGSKFLVGVMHDVTQAIRSNEQLRVKQKQLEIQAVELKQLLSHDQLTGCLNRRALFEQGPIQVEPYGDNWALHVLDIDHFKNINDILGDDAGDAALVHFCNTIRETLREQDLFARLGGEEFAVLLPDVNEYESTQIAKRICALVQKSGCHYEGQMISMTVSIGAVCGESGVPFSLDTALKYADEALYTAKEEGRNRFVRAA